MLDYDTIADELDEELNGTIERCYYDSKDCILRADPSIHPNRRYNENNVQIVYLDSKPSKKRIKEGLR